jgi:hypothetical protein
LSLLVLTLVALSVACGSATGSSSGAAGPASATAETFATSIATLPPLTDTGGKGGAVDGIQCGPEVVQYHIHAHLAILLDGINVVVPAGIGITPPRTAEQGFITGGTCFYWLHTHDTSGVIHVESPSSQLYTLKQFFDVWGEPLTATQIATFAVSPDKPLHVFLNGQPYDQPPDQIQLTAHALITLEIGKQVPPPTFGFPPGL